MTAPDPGYTFRHELADQLDQLDWPSVADDIREGVPPETVLTRLADIGEDDSEAATLIRDYL